MPSWCRPIDNKVISALLTFLALSPTTLQAAEGEPGPLQGGEPYKLQIVLTVAQQRMLTEVLQDTLERELSEGLQAALGGMARVDVVRHHELVAKIEKEGPIRALEGMKRSDSKTHFLFLDYDDPYYRVRGIQHDGLTGQVSPIVRVEMTRDRDFVARLAAKLIEKDFGIVGTVVEPIVNERTTLKLRGGPGVDWSRWVKPGDVFALVEQDGELIPSAYLQVHEAPREATGTCVCKVGNRFKLPTFQEGNPFQAIKLGTTSGPIRIRLVRAVENNPFKEFGESSTVEFRSGGVGGKAQLSLPASSATPDIFDTASSGKSGEFHNLVYVTVVSGETTLAEVPVPILGQPEVIVPILKGVRDDPLRVLEESWKRNVAEAYLIQSDLMRNLQTLASQPDQRGEAIKLARRTLERTLADITRLKRDRAELKDKDELKEADIRLAKLAEARPEIEAFLARLEEIEAKENDPRRAEAKTKEGQAKLLESQGELEKALTIYSDLQKQKLLGDYAAKIQELEGILTPKNDAHAAARRFILEAWPKLTTPELVKGLDEAQKAFEECKKVGDKFGPKRLLDLAVPHAVRVDREKASIRPLVTPQAEIDQLNTVGTGLKKLAGEIDAYLKTPAR
jgi:hypothetical protein